MCLRTWLARGGLLEAQQQATTKSKKPGFISVHVVAIDQSGVPRHFGARVWILPSGLPGKLLHCPTVMARFLEGLLILIGLKPESRAQKAELCFFLRTEAQVWCSVSRWCQRAWKRGASLRPRPCGLFAIFGPFASFALPQIHVACAALDSKLVRLRALPFIRVLIAGHALVPRQDGLAQEGQSNGLELTIFACEASLQCTALRHPTRPRSRRTERCWNWWL